MLLRFLDHIIYQEVPKLFSQPERRGLVHKTTAQQSKVPQFETDKNLDLKNFLLKFLDIIHHELPKLKSSSQQDLVDLVESTGFQDPQTAAAETSGSHYYSSDGKLEL
jgi:ubiquitin C-terminal hydrolase